MSPCLRTSPRCFRSASLPVLGLGGVLGSCTASLHISFRETLLVGSMPLGTDSNCHHMFYTKMIRTQEEACKINSIKSVWHPFLTAPTKYPPGSSEAEYEDCMFSRLLPPHHLDSEVQDCILPLNVAVSHSWMPLIKPLLHPRICPILFNIPLSTWLSPHHILGTQTNILP